MKIVNLAVIKVLSYTRGAMTKMLFFYEAHLESCFAKWVKILIYENSGTLYTVELNYLYSMILK